MDISEIPPLSYSGLPKQRKERPSITVSPMGYLQPRPAYSPVEAMQLSRDMQDNLHKYIAEGCEFSDEEWKVLKPMYDREIEHIQSLPTNRETIFIITSDHGELFGEHGLIVAELDEKLHEWEEKYGSAIAHSEETLPQETLDHLQEMGYITD